jgi:hypothetical protein
MQFRDISEAGSYARFSVQIIVMYLITAFAFYLITAAYV